MPLGSLLGFLEALLGGLKSAKMPTVPRENHFFINTGLWFFEDLNALLGSSWSLLGRSGPKMGPNMVANLIKKLVQKLSKKI